MFNTTIFKAIPYINDVGQTLNPGDKVAYIGMSRGRVSTYVGLYEGVRINERTGKVASVRVGEVKDRVFRYDVKTRTGSYKEVLRKATLPNKRVYKIA